MMFLGTALFIIGCVSKLPQVVTLGVLVFIVGSILNKIDVKDTQ